MRVTPTALLALAVLGCADSAPPPTGPSFQIEVAPLSLPGAGEVCYGLYVQNGSGELVAYQANVCSSRYGNGPGGAITYVIPCDASTTPSAANADHTITLVLEGIDLDPSQTSTNWLSESTYINPCGWPDPTDPTAALVNSPTPLPLDTNPPYDLPDAQPGVNWDGHRCQRTATCQPNGDVLVSFDITVMRNANQGFFDIAVNFEDIFCSAKFDCEDDGGQPLTLLHDASGKRATTTVMALACTGGNGADTHLYLSDVTITCANLATPIVLDPSAGPGNVYSPAHPAGSQLVFQYAVYEGEESLPLVNKAYWNLAIGVDTSVLATAGLCTLTAVATASDGPLPNARPPENATYPLIEWTIPFNPGGSSVLGCGKNPLGSLGVLPTYTTPDKRPCFPYLLEANWTDATNAVDTRPTGNGPAPTLAYLGATDLCVAPFNCHFSGALPFSTGGAALSGLTLVARLDLGADGTDDAVVTRLPSGEQSGDLAIFTISPSGAGFSLVLGSNPGLAIGSHRVSVSVQDECGNTTSSTVTLDARDCIPPIAICTDQISVSLRQTDGAKEIQVSDIDEGSYDNCSTPLTFSIRRAAESPDPDITSITVTCDDLDDSVSVFLDVWDAAGNANSCWADVYVEDKSRSCP